MKIFAEKVIILYKNKVAADLQRLSQQLIYFDIRMKILEKIYFFCSQMNHYFQFNLETFLSLEERIF